MSTHEHHRWFKGECINCGYSPDWQLAVEDPMVGFMLAADLCGAGSGVGVAT